ncbi:MAG: transporter [Gemmatimonadetes bacterium]|nr:transporter [Gemmatimonadota bacterium]
MRTTRSSANAFAAILTVLVLTVPGTARAQEDHDHDHERASARHLGHGHDHGGFPEYVDVFFTHHAYLERKIHPRVQSTMADGDSEYEGSAELAWRFSERIGGEVAVPYAVTDPETDEGASGFGDVEVAPMVALVQDPERLLIVSARSGFVLPTGDEEEGLGIDGWGWEPALLLWKGFGSDRRGALQAGVGYDRIFSDRGDDEEEIVYNLAFSWWLPSNFIPIVEFNGVTPIGVEVEEPHEAGHPEALSAARGPLAAAHGGPEAGEDTLLAGTLGFRYAFANGQQWGGGVQVPLTGDDVFEARLVVGGILHLR